MNWEIFPGSGLACALVLAVSGIQRARDIRNRETTGWYSLLHRSVLDPVSTNLRAASTTMIMT